MKKMYITNGYTSVHDMKLQCENMYFVPKNFMYEMLNA